MPGEAAGVLRGEGIARRAGTRAGEAVRGEDDDGRAPRVLAGRQCSTERGATRRFRRPEQQVGCAEQRGVHRHQALAVIEIGEERAAGVGNRGGVAEGIATGRLRPQDLGAEVGEQAGGEGERDIAAQFQHAQPGERL